MKRWWFGLLGLGWLGVGACFPSTGSKEPLRQGEPTAERAVQDSGSKPPDVRPESHTEDTRPLPEPRPEPRPESRPESLPEPSLPQPCTKEGETRCQHTPETCTRLSSGPLEWLKRPVCLEGSFCANGSCLPFPQPSWILRSHKGINLFSGNHQIEVDAQGYAYLLTGWMWGAQFGATQAEPPPPRLLDRYLIHATPQGAWQHVRAIEKERVPDHGESIGEPRLARSPKGDVYLVCSFADKLEPGVPITGFGDLFVGRLAPAGGFATATRRRLGASSFEEVLFDSKGNLYVFGWHYNAIFKGTPQELPAAPPEQQERSRYIAKYDAQGQPAWARLLPSSIQDLAFQLDTQDTLWFHGTLLGAAAFGEVALPEPSDKVNRFWARMDGNGVWLSASSFPSTRLMWMQPSLQGLPLVWGCTGDWSHPLFSSFQKDKGNCFVGQLNLQGAWGWLHQVNSSLGTTSFTYQRQGVPGLSPQGTLFFPFHGLRFGERFSFSPSVDKTASSSLLEETSLGLDAKGQLLSWAVPYGCVRPLAPLAPCTIAVHQLRVRDGFLYLLATFDGDLVVGERRLPPYDGENFLLAKWPLP